MLRLEKYSPWCMDGCLSIARAHSNNILTAAAGPSIITARDAKVTDMEWLIVIAQMCQVSVATGLNYSIADSQKIQAKCQNYLIDCTVKTGVLAACIKAYNVTEVLK